MEPRISVITLGVDDLQRSFAFYKDGLGFKTEGIIGEDDLQRSFAFYKDGLGFKTEGIIGEEFEHGAVAFFDLQKGLKLAIWARKDIAYDTQLKKTPPSPTEFTLGHNVRSKTEVEKVMEQAEKAGAKIIKSAQNTFYGGYAGYFQDPDGHVWEVVWNPAWDFTE